MYKQGLFLKVKACIPFFRKSANKEKKRAKYLKIWAKMYKIWKYFFEKGQPRACDYHMHETATTCPDRSLNTSCIRANPVKQNSQTCIT